MRQNLKFMEREWQILDALTDELKRRFTEVPKVAVVLGSGLGDVANSLKNCESEPTSTFAHWPVSTVAGHSGKIHLGQLGRITVALLQGRVHLYEGYGVSEVVRPVRAARLWGAEVVLLTNAAGGIDTNFEPGQLMVFEDHLNLTGRNPLIGPNDDSRGPRFPDLTGLYDQKLKDQMQRAAKELGISLKSGVYAGLTGPTYETPAEVRMLKGLGAQAVGMSTVLEAIAARHLGARVAAVSCITNRAAGIPGAVLDHDDVQHVASQAAGDLTRLITHFFSHLAFLTRSGGIR